MPGISLAVNGRKFAVPSSVDPTLPLYEYLRSSTPFKGSKLGCGEGGCGACAVEVTRVDCTTVIFKHLRGGGKAGAGAPAEQMAAHIARIAGQHVRAAATVGGNLTLARTRKLESDLAPLLLAAGARVTLASEAGQREVSMAELLDQGSDLELGTREIVESVTLPAGRAGDVFWSHRISHRYVNSVALINAAFSFNLDSNGKTVKEARVVFGLPGADGWQIRACAGVEAALAGAALAPHTLVAALEALPADTRPAPEAAEFIDAVAQGILLEALAPLVQQGTSEADGPALAALLAARRMAAPEIVRCHQDFSPPDAATAPVGEPIEKDRAKLQASGEALYTSDIVMPADGLFGVFVESTEALAELKGVDAGPALALPGVAAYVDIRDVPKGGANLLDACGTDIIFADGRVEYVGQRIGIILAESQLLAEAGAKLVRVHYAKPAALGEPLLTIQQAIHAESMYDLSDIDAENFVRRCGDAKEALPGSKHTIMGARFSTPSQQHMYMEPQAALAVPDEGGAILVHSSTQCIDMVQTAVAAALGLPYNKVIARVRRLGGGFGGKSSRSIPIAAAAAVAAHRLRRPVRIVLNRNADLRMIGGRNEMDAEFDVGFDDEGRFQALAVRAWLLGGAQVEISDAESQIFVTSLDQNYAIPHLEVETRLVRTNLPPRTIMRGPGTMQAVLLVEHIVDRIAAHLGADPVLVRERNLLTKPRAEVVRRPCAGTPAFPLATNENTMHHAYHEHPKPDHETANGGAHGAANGTANGAANGAANGVAGEFPTPSGAKHGVSEEVVPTALQSEIPLDQFTVPRLWYELKDACQYEARLAEVEAFNRDNLWRKRGISMTTCRFVMTVGAKPATVHVYHDGTVLVLCPGHEMGQGLFTKVRQAAAMALSNVLPASQRPFPIDLINIADNASDLLPNAGPSWGSTTSEASCEAVRLACNQLARTLAPHFNEAGAGATWQDVIKTVHPEVGFSASKVLLTSTAYYDGTQRHASGQKNLEYNGYGSAASEVEVDVLTGEVRVRRGDVMIDAGHSLNPAVDIGQAEGGYVQGLGMMLSEDVKVDSATGRLLSDSTWTYKIPGADTIPRVMNVHLLKKSPHARGILSSKAVGEPPLLLSASAFSAIQVAVNAARADLAARGARALTSTLPGGDAVVRLRAPATPARVKAAIGSFNISELLRAAT